MYNENSLHEEDAYDGSSIGMNDMSSIDSDMIERHRMLEEYKKTDKSFYKIKRIIGRKNTVKIDCYSSPVLRNAFIRNAVTGIRFNHRVGSIHEDLYFVVTDTTGAGRKYGSNEPRKLYYHTPEEFERHQSVVVAQEVKDNWNVKYRKAFHRFCE